jgi:hypothetical protein
MGMLAAAIGSVTLLTVSDAEAGRRPRRHGDSGGYKGNRYYKDGYTNVVGPNGY